MGKLIDAAALMDALWQVHHHAGDSPEAAVYMEDVARIVDKMLGGLSEQEHSDVENIRRIRGGRALKIVTRDYTIVNEAWRKKNPWELPRHGRWHELRDYSYGDRAAYECSECGMIASSDFGFCPACGAMMDGGGKDGGD